MATSNDTGKENKMDNNKYVNFSNPIELAQYLSELTKQCVEYIVTKETNGSHSVLIVGF